MTTLVAGCAALWDLIAGADEVPAPGSVGWLQAGPGVFGQWLPGGAAPTVALAMAAGGCQVALWHPLPDRERDEFAFRFAASEIDLSRCPRAPWAGHCVVIRTGTEALLWSSQTPSPPTPIQWNLNGIDNVVICPRWGSWLESLLATTRSDGIKASLVGTLPREAFEWDWDTVVVSDSQVRGVDLSQLRARIAVVTKGNRGSSVRMGDGWTEVAPWPAKVVDATGAGDVFAGALLANLESGQTPETAAQEASRAAAVACEEWGAQTSLMRKPRLGSQGQLSRARGALWGLACGDAFGMPNAFIPTRDRLRVWGTVTDLVSAPRESPYHAGYEAGQVTDDTQQAFALTQAYARSRGALDPELVAQELWRWLELNGGPDSRAVGPSTRTGLLEWRNGVSVTESGRRGTSNGGAMRITPIGVVHGLRQSSQDQILESVVAACLPTHNTGPAISAAAGVAAAVAAGVAGAPWTDVLESGPRAATAARGLAPWIYAPDVARRIDHAMRVATSHKGDDDFLSEVSEVVGSGEPAAEAIPAAFAVSARAQGDPAHAIRLAGNLEGDSDTIAAIAGAICGAWAGEDSVPAKWREQVGAVNNLDVAGWAAQLKAIAADHVPEKV